MSNLCAELI
jgi:hypothetical protein